MPQLSRLAIIFIMLIAGFIAARYLLVPETFGELGHYRAAAIDDIVAQPIQYAGHEICYECHDDILEIKRASYHTDVNCEVCHGPGAEHVEDFEVLPPAPRNRGFCPLCHEYNPSRPTGFPQIEPVSHNLGEPCITCHDPHDPEPPYVPEECSACHGQIARTKAISHHAPLPCERCHETDEEHKVTPRLVRPSKPQTRAVCGGCHAAGAVPPMEGVLPPHIDMNAHYDNIVCWQCHYPHHPEVG